MREADFSLPVKERALYGATVTARSLDAQAGRYRVVCISTPVSIQRDIYASRVALEGSHGSLTP